MAWLGAQDKTIFIGQGVGNAGTAMSDTLDGVASHKRIEFPVAEEMQVGMCVGMSLSGLIPICIIPRWNFVLRAADQIVNHLDGLPLYSGGGFRPRVIIRIAAPSTAPFDPGPQHDADFSDAFAVMLRTVPVIKLHKLEDVVSVYQSAFMSERSAIVVEYTEHYRNVRGEQI